jgi:hypothetical protein
MRHRFDRGDDRALESRLRIRAVVDEIEAVGNRVGL